MATIQTNLTCELQNGSVAVQYLNGVLFTQDNQANQINVAVYDGGEPATISGTVSGNVIRSDGGTVAVTGGSISGNVASITLPAAAYAVPGVASIIVKLSTSGVVTTLAAVVANIYESSTATAIDPGTIIPSVTALVAQIDTAVASIPADYSTLWTTLAPAFSTSATYAAGQYVTYNGGLYRFTAAHTGAWSSSDVVAANIGNDLSDLKSAIDQLGVEFYNLFDPDNIHDGKYLDGNGVLSSNATYATTKFIDVSDYDSLAFSFTNWGAWYSTDNESGFISPLNSSDMNSLSSDKSATVPTNAKYLRVTVQKSNIDKVQIGRIADRNNYVGHKRYLLPDVDVESDQIRGVEYLEEKLGYSKYNLFDKNDVNDGKYLDGNGALSSNSSYVTSNFIDITGHESVSFSYTVWGAWYSSDNQNDFISPLNTTGMSTGTEDKTVTVPTGAKYLRVTALKSNIDLVQVGEKVNRDKYIAHDKIYLRDVIFDNEEGKIIVAIDGSGDYTSLTEAVYENVDNGITIIVRPGTYDVKAEYIALFGQDVVDSLADATSGINNFQYGIRIHDRKVVFMPGSKVICDWTGKTIDGTHRFCAFRVEPGAEIEGLYLVCTATFYGIHDDYGPATPFTIKYKNCRIDCYSLYNANCIGGGCHKYSRHILDNCYFNNNVNSSDIVLSADVRYHNTNTADAEPEVYVSNCYFSNNLNLAYYGTQTTKMRAYVNNCYAPKGINKVRESSSMNTDNVDLYAWNNQTE